MVIRFPSFLVVPLIKGVILHYLLGIWLEMFLAILDAALVLVVSAIAINHQRILPRPPLSEDFPQGPMCDWATPF